MMLEIIKPSEFTTTAWSGGTTTELFIYPENTSYSERNFDFRISVATVELETSTFTKLPGIERHLAVLEGEMTLSFENRGGVLLRPYDIATFQGDWLTTSVGRVTDFNLMTRRGIGRMSAERVSASCSDIHESGRLFLFCPCSDMIVSIPGESHRVERGCLFHLEGGGGQIPYEISTCSGQEIRLLKIQLHQNRFVGAK